MSSSCLMRLCFCNISSDFSVIEAIIKRNFLNSASKLYQHAFQPAPVLAPAGFTHYEAPQNFLAQDAIYNFSFKDPLHDKKKTKKNAPFIHSGPIDITKHLDERPLNNYSKTIDGTENDESKVNPPHNHNHHKEKKERVKEINIRMRDQLIDLGYSSEDVAVLTYIEAEMIITKKQRKLE